MVDLDLLQQDMHDWCRHNFPNATAMDEFLGVVEEVGELSHAILKGMEGIREGSPSRDDDLYLLHVDAIGDILVYLFNYCSFMGINVRGALEMTWEKVSKRDWVADPERGGEAAHAES